MSITTDALELAKGFLNAPPATDGWDELLYGETVAPVAQRQPEGFRALAYRALSRGSRMLPIQVGAKKPLVAWAGTEIDVLPLNKWLEVAPAYIEDWANRFPSANCCEIGKPDEKCMLDEDSDDFRTGFESWAGVPFPRTFTTSARAGHKQSHWYQTDKTHALGNVGQDKTVNAVLSLRQKNMYVISEGSQYKDGVNYYDVVDDSPIIPMPDKLAEYIQHLINDKQKKEKPKKDGGSKADLDSPFIEGQIHPRLVSIAGYYVQKKNIDDADELYSLLIARLEKNGCFYEDGKTPFSYDEKKVRQVAESAVQSWETGEEKRKRETLVLNLTPSDAPPLEEEAVDLIPPFDPSVVNGIYKKFVDVATRGTTMAPQFVYAIAKTVVAARMAGKVKFENLDVEPRFYTALIGETGSGKGEAWRRVLQILNCEGQTESVSGLKIINSADSGAGIRDAFFEIPAEAPMLMYIDEIESFGNKSAPTRNPAILDMLIELADSTSISVVKAKKGNAKSSKTKNDARLCAVMCGQEGSVYMKAFAGKTKLGLWDRLTPEFSVATEAGDLPHIVMADAHQLLAELVKLDYSGTMTMADDAKSRLETFWLGQPAAVRKKARWKKNLALDAYMSAFGRGSKVAELDDVEIAIKIFTRQLVIRQTHFTSEVPDRIGYYLGLLKEITAKMERQLAAGVPEGAVAKSRRDFERATHAHRDNDAHIFERAWAVYAPTWLEKREVTKANGHKYAKYVPATDE